MACTETTTTTTTNTFNRSDGERTPSPTLPEIRVRDRRVHWDDAVVDNENLGRKKSNICCTFHSRNPKLDPNSPCFDPEDDKDEPIN